MYLKLVKTNSLDYFQKNIGYYVMEIDLRNGELNGVCKHEQDANGKRRPYDFSDMSDKDLDNLIEMAKDRGYILERVGERKKTDDKKSTDKKKGVKRKK